MVKVKNQVPFSDSGTAVWVPKYIKQNQSMRAKDVVTSSDWNNLFNLVIAQGDWNSEAINKLINTGDFGIQFAAHAENADKLGGKLPSYYTEYSDNVLSQSTEMFEEAKRYTDEVVTRIGAADMLMSTYDTNRNGIVDNAEALGGVPADTINDFVRQSKEDISDLQANKVNKSDMATLTSSKADKTLGNVDNTTFKNKIISSGYDSRTAGDIVFSYTDLAKKYPGKFLEMNGSTQYKPNYPDIGNNFGNATVIPIQQDVAYVGNSNSVSVTDSNSGSYDAFENDVDTSQTVNKGSMVYAASYNTSGGFVIVSLFNNRTKKIQTHKLSGQSMYSGVVKIIDGTGFGFGLKTDEGNDFGSSDYTDLFMFFFNTETNTPSITPVSKINSTRFPGYSGSVYGFRFVKTNSYFVLMFSNSGSMSTGAVVYYVHYDNVPGIDAVWTKLDTSGFTCGTLEPHAVKNTELVYFGEITHGSKVTVYDFSTKKATNGTISMSNTNQTYFPGGINFYRRTTGDVPSIVRLVSPSTSSSYKTISMYSTNFFNFTVSLIATENDNTRFDYNKMNEYIGESPIGQYAQYFKGCQYLQKQQIIYRQYNNTTCYGKVYPQSQYTSPCISDVFNDNGSYVLALCINDDYTTGSTWNFYAFVRKWMLRYVPSYFQLPNISASASTHGTNKRPYIRAV